MRGCLSNDRADQADSLRRYRSGCADGDYDMGEQMSKGKRKDGVKRAVKLRDGAVPSAFSKENQEKFWEIIGRNRHEHECWIWPLSIREESGHGTFCLIGGCRVNAGRYMLSIAKRMPFPGEIAKSTCGNTACVNPDHMEWARRSSMMKERCASGEHFLPCSIGELNPAAILDDEKVMFIRQADMTGKALAALFGVAATTISMAQLGETWSHLPGARTNRRVGTPDGGYVNI